MLIGTSPRKGTCISAAGFRAAGAEDFVPAAALRADEVAHILHHAEHLDVDLAKHRDRLDRIEQRYILGRADDDRAGQRQELRECDCDVAGARRHVDHQVVELAPGGVAEKLRDRPVQHGSSPDDRFMGRHEQPHGKDADPLDDHRLDLAVPHQRPLLRAEEVRDAGTVNVGVHQADLGAGSSQPDGQRRGNGALADPPLTGADGDHRLGLQTDFTEFLRWPVMLGQLDIDFGQLRQAAPEMLDQVRPRLAPERREKTWSRRASWQGDRRSTSNREPAQGQPGRAGLGVGEFIEHPLDRLLVQSAVRHCVDSPQVSICSPAGRCTCPAERVGMTAACLGDPRGQFPRPGQPAGAFQGSSSKIFCSRLWLGRGTCAR